MKGSREVEKRIRVGIIGSGGIAGGHARSYKEIPGVDIVAVADIIPDRAQQFIQAHELEGAQAFDDYHRLLELDLDGVSICTPNIAHHQTSVDALNAGKHVLVEKPMSVTLEQAVEMVQVSKKSSKMLSVGFQPRYDPNMKIIQDIVQSGQLGNVYYVQTGGGRRRGIPGKPSFVSKDIAGAGAMADIGCYSLDMALNALGHPKPLTVSAVTSNLLGTNPKYCHVAEHFNVEDFGVALIRLEGGITLNFKISWAMHMDTLGDTLFLGSGGGLKVTPANGVWDGRLQSITLYHDVMGFQTESPIPIKNHNVKLFFEKVNAFVDAIREGKPAPIPGEQILMNQAIIDGVLRSAELGREVDIVIPEV